MLDLPSTQGIMGWGQGAPLPMCMLILGGPSTSKQGKGGARKGGGNSCPPQLACMSRKEVGLHRFMDLYSAGSEWASSFMHKWKQGVGGSLELADLFV